MVKTSSYLSTSGLALRMCDLCGCVRWLSTSRPRALWVKPNEVDHRRGRSVRLWETRWFTTSGSRTIAFQPTMPSRQSRHGHMPVAAIGLGCEKKNFCDNQCHQSQRPQGTHIRIPLNVGLHNLYATPDLVKANRFHSKCIDRLTQAFPSELEAMITKSPLRVNRTIFGPDLRCPLVSRQRRTSRHLSTAA
ncbi:hypothetical protein ABIA06_005650 [Bradyrhizobium yuanmingense]